MSGIRIYTERTTAGGSVSDIDGLTLRDLFAMAALAGTCADPRMGDPGACAAFAFNCADAMLKAREESK